MSALTFKPRGKGKRFGFCEHCDRTKVNARQAKWLAEIMGYPVARLCDPCAKAWQRLWVVAREGFRERVAA